MEKTTLSIVNLTPTLCNLMGVSKPQLAVTELIEEIKHYAKKLNIEKIDKCLIFAPDAVGAVTYEKYKALFKEVEKVAPLSINLNSVYMPVTPVCFASMFTGVLPEVHGIIKYEKPVLKIDTIFDSLIKENKKPTIVAVKNSSIDMIFRNREMNYHSEIYDTEVIEKTTLLLTNKVFKI